LGLGDDDVGLLSIAVTLVSHVHQSSLVDEGVDREADILAAAFDVPSVRLVLEVGSSQLSRTLLDLRQD
jgi:hypothetical protein